MFAIFQKEINAFFASLIGYVVIAVFLIVMGLFLFVFPDTSLLNYGYATLGPFFTLAPNVLLFIIPAISMRAFAEERQTGAIELLVTRPLRDIEIVLGKFLACLALVVIALLPTLLYYYTVYQLGEPVGNIDAGGTMGSYLGLLFLSMAFVAIGLFASSLTTNQIVSFLLALALTFWVYFGFDYLASLPVFYGNGDAFISGLGMQEHFQSLGRGLIDSRDVVYFLSLTAFFVLLTVLSLERRKW
ncbi:ABC-2 type transport system permease protein [Lewinella aquimaris]|uniref:ABC-2 type transport system permease protein n=1 Tax=Neolewinella aquimaris TaxID=1835722 RepID=A0A840E7T0_9BACT|nr:gliding motility-associated ABC transporter permease subunit GldF [Neolewinella aquimaris]MBB4078118.1 ABC-2 type transport system permease protein [Neolewinella aquimaris]